MFSLLNMANYTLTGKVIHIGNVEVFGKTAKKFEKRTLVVGVPHDKYPQEIPFEASGKAISLLDHLREDDEIEVVFTLKGKQGNNGKWWGNIVLVGINSEEVQNRVTNGVSGKAKQAEANRAAKFDNCHNYENEEIEF